MCQSLATGRATAFRPLPIHPTPRCLHRPIAVSSAYTVSSENTAPALVQNGLRTIIYPPNCPPTIRDQEVNGESRPPGLLSCLLSPKMRLAGEKLCAGSTSSNASILNGGRKLLSIPRDPKGNHDWNSEVVYGSRGHPGLSPSRSGKLS